jgi:TP901 family phage tail tape measure protein
VAETQTQAKLGLVITAENQAKQVFEDFAATLAEDMKKIEESMKNGFNMEAIVRNVQESSREINKALGSSVDEEKVSASFKKLQETVFITREEMQKDFDVMELYFENLGMSSVKAADLTDAQLKKMYEAINNVPYEVFANKGQQAFDKLDNAVVVTESQLTEMFNSMKGEFKSLGEVVDGSMQMGVNGMKDFVQANMSLAAGSEVVVKVIKDIVPEVDKFAQAEQELASKTVMTKTELIDAFDAIKASFANGAYAAVDSSQLTINEMQKVVEASQKTKLAIVSDIQESIPEVSRFQRAEQEMADTVVMTRSNIVDAFNQIKGAFLNGAYASVDATQLTDSQLLKIVETAHQLKISMVADMQETSNETASALDRMRNVVYMTSSELQKEFSNIRQSMESLKNVDPSQMTDQQMRNIVQAVNGMEIQVVRDFQQVGSEAQTMSQRMEAASKAFQFGEMMNAGMQLQMTGERALGFFKDAIKAGADFDQSIVNATASLDANRVHSKLSSDMIDEMRQKSIELGSAGYFSANQVADAMNIMAKQGMEYSMIMGGGIKTVHDVAASNQQDLAKTASTISDIYNEMHDVFVKNNVDVGEATQQIGNGMTVAMHHANISMDDFLNTMKYVGPVASTAGLSFKDVATEIAILGEHGIKASQAGTTLRRELVNMIPQNKEAAAVMAQLHLTTGQVADAFFDQAGQVRPLDQVQATLANTLGGLNDKMKENAIRAIFGVYALAGMNAVVSTSPQKFKELRGEMDNNGLMQQILTEKSMGLGFALQRLQAHFETLKKEIGMAFKPVLEAVLPVINVMMDKWDAMNPKIRNVIVVLAGFAAAAAVVGGALLTAVGMMGMFAASAVPAIAGISKLMATMRMMSIPVLVVVAAIALLRVAWEKDFGGIREATSHFVTWFEPLFSKTFATVKKDVDAGIKAITKGFDSLSPSTRKSINEVLGFLENNFFAGLKKMASDTANAITTVTGWFHKMAPEFNKAFKNLIAFFQANSTTFKALFEVLGFVVKLAFSIIEGIFQHAWGVFSGIVQFFTHIINGEWKKAFADLWQIISNAFLLALDLWGGFAGKTFGWIGKLLEHLGIFGEGFGKIFGAAFKLMGKLCDEGWQYAERVFKGSIDLIGGLLKGWFGVIGNIFEAIKSLIHGDASGAMHFLEDAFRSGVSAAGQVIQGLLGIIDGALGGLPSKMLGWGKNAIKMFADGIKSGIGAIGDAVTGAADKIKSILGFHSPAKEGPAGKGESDQWMGNLMTMLANDIDKNKDKVQKATLGVALGIQQNLSGTQDHVHKIMNGSSSGAAITHNNGNNRNQVVNINIEGRSAQSDKQLAENIAKQFRTQISMVM